MGSAGLNLVRTQGQTHCWMVALQSWVEAGPRPSGTMHSVVQVLRKLTSPLDKPTSNLYLNIHAGAATKISTMWLLIGIDTLRIRTMRHQATARRPPSGWLPRNA